MAAALGSQERLLQVRTLEARDRDALRRLFGRLSSETVYRRFMSPLPELPEPMLNRLVDLDHLNREALAVVEGAEIVGVARYARAPGRPAAEVAVVVADAWQGHGLGRLLLKHLGRLARSRGVEAFTASVLGENRGVLYLARSLSPATTAHWSAGQIELQIPLRSPNR